MSEPISPATLGVLERYHRRVQNQILKLKEQEDWKCYCVEHKIPVQCADQPTGTKKAAIRKTAQPQKKAPSRVCRKATAGSPAYSVKSLAEQLKVYYNQLEKLSADYCVVDAKQAATQGSGVDNAKPNVVDVGTSPIDDTNWELERNEGILDKTFRVMLNSDPNERFCVVKKERVFRSPDTHRWQASPVPSLQDQVKVTSKSEAQECDAPEQKQELAARFLDNAARCCDEVPEPKPPIALDVPDHLDVDIERYKTAIGSQMRWKKPFSKLEDMKNPWTFIENASNDILEGAMESVLLELEEIFSCVVDELLGQEFLEPLS